MVAGSFWMVTPGCMHISTVLIGEHSMAIICMLECHSLTVVMSTSMSCPCRRGDMVLLFLSCSYHPRHLKDI